MKKLKNFAIIAAVILILGASALAKEAFEVAQAQIRPDFTIEVDGVKRTFKSADGKTVYPLLHDGVTYLPLRAIGELMGKTVYWYEDEKRVELREETVTVTDADVIVSGDEKPAEKPNPPKPALPKEADDFIGADKAQKLALNRAGLAAGSVKFDRTELDKENGVWVYEVEFQHGRTEYEAEIRAEDGAILKWKTDRDD